MDCIAHRGFAGVFPENTLAAVRGAAAADADWIEVDVRRCGSGEPVVIHDATVDRVTDGSGAVAELSSEQLGALDVLGTGTGVPTLAAVVEACPDAVGMLVDLKTEDAGHGDVEPLATDVLASLADHGGSVLLSSFDPAALAACRSVDPTVDRALLVGPEDDTGSGASDPVSLATDLGCAAIHPHHRLCPTGQDSPAEPDLVARAHAADLRVNAWTVRTVETARALQAAGVDGLISDAPAHCIA